jgi:outer membrane protein TolC
MKRTIIILVLFIRGMPLFAQQELSPDEFLNAVRNYHPVIKQAALGVKIAGAEITQSRGAFDPVLDFDQQDKKFDGTEYYDRQITELKIPTWYGIDLYAGREIANGERLNNSETSGSIDFVGVSLDPIQTVLLDKRRATLQQAKIFRQQSLAQQRNIANNLLSEALETYFDWWQHHRELILVRQTLDNATQTFGMVKQMYAVGERPAIDTLEAYAQVQAMRQYENEIWTKLLKSRLQLSVYLWNQEGNAYELPMSVVPAPAIPEEILLDTLLTGVAQHPALQELDYEVDALQVNKRLKFAELLPGVELKYNQMARETSKIFNGSWFQNNNRFGVGVNVPLRLSQGRGAYSAARFKLMQGELKRSNKQVELENKIKQQYLEWQQLKVQMRQQETLVASYNGLLSGEQIKFANGESSLFLLNSRQLKALEAQQKMAKMQADVFRAQVKVKWAAGILQ